MPTKHEKIIQYIKNLELGHKISVRQIAKLLHVSEGTAYRAIKEAETQGMVQTIERVGTVRIEQMNRSGIEKLTFAEVVNIVDGQVLGGRDGLHKTLNRFVIGAMKLEAMLRYVEPGSLLIAGNRDQVHRMSLQHGAAILVTGGFGITDEVKKLSNQHELPVISSSYDTFTVATLINRAIYDRLIKKKILLVEDVLNREEPPVYLNQGDSIADFHQQMNKSNHARFPVIDNNKRVVGMITMKDVMGVDLDERVEKAMTKNPIVVSPQNSLASAAHEMVWEGIELLPVIDERRQLLGVIGRQDVIRSLQHMQKQPQITETIQESSVQDFDEVVRDDCNIVFQGQVSPQMVDSLGNISVGVLTSLMTETALRLLRRKHQGELAVQSFTIYMLKPIQMESVIEIVPRILDMGRKQAKMEIEVKKEQQIVTKALLMTHIIDR